jgi:hypothetical protein
MPTSLRIPAQATSEIQPAPTTQSTNGTAHPKTLLGPTLINGTYFILLQDQFANFARFYFSVDGLTWSADAVQFACRQAAVFFNKNSSLFVVAYSPVGAGAQPVRLANYNPATKTWSTFGIDGTSSLAIFDVVQLSNNDVCVGCLINSTGDKYFLQHWNGVAWVSTLVPETAGLVTPNNPGATGLSMKMAVHSDNTISIAIAESDGSFGGPTTAFGFLQWKNDAITDGPFNLAFDNTFVILVYTDLIVNETDGYIALCGYGGGDNKPYVVTLTPVINPPGSNAFVIGNAGNMPQSLSILSDNNLHVVGTNLFAGQTVITQWITARNTPSAGYVESTLFDSTTNPNIAAPILSPEPVIINAASNVAFDAVDNTVGFNNGRYILTPQPAPAGNTPNPRIDPKSLRAIVLPNICCERKICTPLMATGKEFVWREL